MTPANIEILTITVMALAEPVNANQLVGFDGGAAVADEPVLGIAKTNGGVNQPLAVISIGVVELVSAANLAAGDRVYADIDGKPTNIGANNPFGTVLKGGPAGDIITILLKS
ncbi:hypothetical protein JI58_06920 [Marinosulfonomonas sp. PRT-SC04]|nr:hypothetical protein JI58_06920 [Marinosulfonomonas sp. PRT-SC04]